MLFLHFTDNDPRSVVWVFSVTLFLSIHFSVIGPFPVLCQHSSTVLFSYTFARCNHCSSSCLAAKTPCVSNCAPAMSSKNIWSSWSSFSWIFFPGTKSSSYSSRFMSSSGLGPAFTECTSRYSSAFICLLSALSTARTRAGGYIRAIFARPFTRWMWRCRSCFPPSRSFVHTPRNVSANSGKLVIQHVGFRMYPSPKTSLPAIFHLHIGPSTISILGIPPISWMHSSFHDFADFGCSCRKYVPFLILCCRSNMMFPTSLVFSFFQSCLEFPWVRSSLGSIPVKSKIGHKAGFL